MNEVRHVRNANNTTVLTRYLRQGAAYVDLTGYSVVIRLTRANVTIEKPCVVHPDQVTQKGRVDWTPISADVSAIGIYRVEFVATNGSETTSFPRGNKQRFYVWIK